MKNVEIKNVSPLKNGCVARGNMTHNAYRLNAVFKNFCEGNS